MAVTRNYDVEIVVEGCPPPSTSPQISSLVAKWAARGAMRFLVTLKDREMEECIDTLREVIQSFISVSFTVREGGGPAGVPRVTVRYLNPSLEIVEEG